MTLLSSRRFKIAPILEFFGAEVKPNTVKILCPFHEDNTASGWHNDYYFKCFACGVQGDAVGLLAREGRLEFAEAYQRAEELAGSPDDTVSDTSLSGRRLSGKQRDYRGHSRFGQIRSGG